MSWDNWDDGKPKLDEARFLSPETPKHRAKKDRKRWCRGKVGVEHVQEPRYEKYALSRAAGRNELPKCEWIELGRYEWAEDRRGRVFVGSGAYYWCCEHEYVCRNCGKIFDRVRRQCVEFNPHDRDYKIVGKPPRSNYWQLWRDGD